MRTLQELIDNVKKRALTSYKNVRDIDIRQVVAFVAIFLAGMTFTVAVTLWVELLKVQDKVAIYSESGNTLNDTNTTTSPRGSDITRPTSDALADDKKHSVVISREYSQGVCGLGECRVGECRERLNGGVCAGCDYISMLTAIDKYYNVFIFLFPLVMLGVAYILSAILTLRRYLRRLGTWRGTRDFTFRQKMSII